MKILNNGIIVSIQGYKSRTIDELASEAVNAGAVAIKSDKPIHFDFNNNNKVSIIGCSKVKVLSPRTEAYLTSTLDLVVCVAKWADYVSVDYRVINKNIKEISDFCKTNKIKVIADIKNYQDFENIKENNYYYTYIATTFSVFNDKFFPDLKLPKILLKYEKNIIAEGNFSTRNQVKEILDSGIPNVCIGGAISNIYKLTRKFTTIKIDINKKDLKNA